MNMAQKDGQLLPQITIGNSETDLIQLAEAMPDGLGWWVEQYFRFEVTTSPASQKVQRRDLALFLQYMTTEERTDQRVAWTPRLSRDFQLHVQKTVKDQGRRVWSDKTMLRIMAHLKTFAKWVHKLRPFPLGNPMAKLKLPAVGMGLEVDRAITPAERRKLLDAADLLLAIGGFPIVIAKFWRLRNDPAVPYAEPCPADTLPELSLGNSTSCQRHIAVARSA